MKFRIILIRILSSPCILDNILSSSVFFRENKYSNTQILLRVAGKVHGDEDEDEVLALQLSLKVEHLDWLAIPVDPNHAFEGEDVLGNCRRHIVDSQQAKAWEVGRHLLEMRHLARPSCSESWRWLTNISAWMVPTKLVFSLKVSLYLFYIFLCIFTWCNRLASLPASVTPFTQAHFKSDRLCMCAIKLCVCVGLCGRCGSLVGCCCCRMGHLHSPVCLQQRRRGRGIIPVVGNDGGEGDSSSSLMDEVPFLDEIVKVASSSSSKSLKIIWSSAVIFIPDIWTKSSNRSSQNTSFHFRVLNSTPKFWTKSEILK